MEANSRLHGICTPAYQAPQACTSYQSRTGWRDRTWTPLGLCKVERVLRGVRSDRVLYVPTKNRMATSVLKFFDAASVIVSTLQITSMSGIWLEK